jgi:hypothetical protein
MLTRVDACDNVSVLRMGTIRDPRFFPLFQAKDQIWLGDWISCPGEEQIEAAGRLS